MINDVEQLFMCLFAICISFLSVKIFCLLFCWVVCSRCWVLKGLYVFWICFYQICALQVFSPFVAYLSYTSENTIFILKVFLKFIYCIYFWLHWVFVAVHGLSLVAVSGGYSSLWCTGFSLRWLLLLQSMGSRRPGFRGCGSQALESRLRSCGTRALLLRGMWDLPEPGIEPMSPALAGGFLTTVPPGKPLIWCIFIFIQFTLNSRYLNQCGFN